MKLENLEIKTRMLEQERKVNDNELKRCNKEWSVINKRLGEEKSKLQGTLRPNGQNLSREAAARKVKEVAQQIQQHRGIANIAAALEAKRQGLINKVVNQNEQLSNLFEKTKLEKAKRASSKEADENDDLVTLTLISNREKPSEIPVETQPELTIGSGQQEQQPQQQQQSNTQERSDTAQISNVSFASNLEVAHKQIVLNEPKPEPTPEKSMIQTAELKSFTSGENAKIEITLGAERGSGAALSLVQDSNKKVSVQFISNNSDLRGELLRRRSHIRSVLERAGVRVGEFVVERS